MVWIICILLLTAADQLIKAVINHNLTPTDKITVIDGFFYLINRKNTGAAWSFLAEPTWGIYFLTVISILMTIALIIVFWRFRLRWLQVCLTPIIAGSLGNLIDRIRLGAVTDYLDFHFGSYVFPTFNLADAMIVVGTGLLVVMLLKNQDSINALFPPKEAESSCDVKEESHAAEHSDH
ncbi:MAG: signal peptidase II [Clostridia bacterium]|nr:signal peptidase II [Clostridia bacterium]